MSNVSNIAELPEDQRQAIQRDLIASGWIHKVRVGKMTRHQVTAKLNDIADPDECEDMRVRLNKFQRVKVTFQ